MSTIRNLFDLQLNLNRFSFSLSLAPQVINIHTDLQQAMKIRREEVAGGPVHRVSDILLERFQGEKVNRWINRYFHNFFVEMVLKLNTFQRLIYTYIYSSSVYLVGRSGWQISGDMRQLFKESGSRPWHAPGENQERPKIGQIPAREGGRSKVSPTSVQGLRF